MSWEDSFRASRRRMLYLLGIGAAGAVVVADDLFARQFAKDTTRVDLPEMIYDADLQVMVDPATRQPIYSRAEMVSAADDDKENKKKKKPKPKPLPTVTSGCDTCPKCDDNCG